MVISVEFFGVQRTITKKDVIKVPLNGLKSARDVLHYVKKQYPELPIDDGAVLITVNHVAASPDMALKPHDTVCFVPGIGGG